MKRFTDFYKQQINESCPTADVNPGNDMTLCVTNHLTPVQNIVTNIKNLFPTVPIVVSVAEDGFSVKINSSQFTSKENVYKVLNTPVYQNQSVLSYINLQGLSDMKMVNLGQFIVVYVGAKDIAASMPGLEPQGCENCVPGACEDISNANLEEAEFINEAEDEEEIEKLTKKQINEIIDAKDKVKAAKQFGIIVAQQISLPQDYYFAGVKSADGDESIALRWKYVKRRPHGKSTEVTRSLMNIFGTGDYAVWVGDFDKKANFELPAEVKKLIESILELLGAEKTSDPCVFKIGDGEKKEDDSKKDEDDKDHEDDDSRGDDSDNNEENNKEEKK